MFDKLDEVRSLARARTVEDFEYFVAHVLGPHTLLTPAAQHEAWVRVVQGSQTEGYLGETFSWLFPELCRKAA